ncbi:MAG: hypothetical protein ABIO40_12405 [Devosia sp.]
MGDIRLPRSRFLRMNFPRPREIAVAEIRMGHNGGPPLDEHVPEWGVGGIGNYFVWKGASAKAFKLPPDTAIRRARKAAELGLTFEEYQLEILERGRYLQVTDSKRIAAIIARRGKR